MRYQGRLTEWNDERGFGFITPLEGGVAVFAHVSQFPHAQRRPLVTDLVTYAVEHDERGRPRAQDVQFLAPTRMRDAQPESLQASGAVMPALMASLVFFMLLVLLGLLTRAVWVVLLIDVLVSAITLFAYREDKAAAQQDRRRTEESALHLMALVGGWPGALVAQQLYRHKTQKRSFRTVFWFTVAGNLLLLVFLIAFSAAAAGG